MATDGESVRASVTPCPHTAVLEEIVGLAAEGLTNAHAYSEARDLAREALAKPCGCEDFAAERGLLLSLLPAAKVDTYHERLALLRERSADA